jgi:hypothetical protein
MGLVNKRFDLVLPGGYLKKIPAFLRQGFFY